MDRACAKRTIVLGSGGVHLEGPLATDTWTQLAPLELLGIKVSPHVTIHMPVINGHCRDLNPLLSYSCCLHPYVNPSKHLIKESLCSEFAQNPTVKYHQTAGKAVFACFTFVFLLLPIL